MSAATIKRAKNAGRAGSARRSASAKRKPSRLAQLWARVPISHEAVQRIVTVVIIVVVGVAIVATATMLGVPAYLEGAAADALGRAGFAVKHVEITGVDKMDRLTVYAVALDQKSRAMPLVDLDRVRDELMQYGWVADARVSRRLPDTLVIDIVERVPAAVWQHNNALSLIDAHGIVLSPVALDKMPELPLVIGPDANVQTTALTELMAHATRLKPLLAGATWVGNRRWDLRFQTGEVLALPEGEREAARALGVFDRLDDQRRLLGRGFIRFDMRDPKNMLIRLSRDHGRIDRVDPGEVPSAMRTPKAAAGTPNTGTTTTIGGIA